MPNNDPPVIIVGGGLVGLSTAMFLARHGIRSLAIERLRNVSPLPRAAHFHMRTLELFRACGIEEEVKAQSLKEFEPEGAVAAFDTLAGKQIAAFVPSLNEGVEAVSPSRRLFITQPGLEPILRRRAEQASALVEDGSELVGIDQDDEGVTATVRDTDTGAERRLRANYLVGADGGHSAVRELLKIPFEGRGVFSNSITIYFEADVAPLMVGRNVSVQYIINPQLSGFFRLDKDHKSGFLCVNTVGDTSKPEASNAAADISEPRLIQLVRAGIGLPDMPVKITGVARWRSVSDVARRYQVGRVFLAGDAAHVMPPNGGFGGNTGIHDAHNLAWKLAYVLNGTAGPGLLETYEAERRPVGKFTVEQAYARYVSRSATYLGARDYEPVAHDFDIEVGYLYRSPAILSQPGETKLHELPSDSFGRPGSRAPHLWIERDGRRISTLDLFGTNFTLLAAVEGEAWVEATRTIRSPAIDAYLFGRDVQDPENRFAKLHGITSSGATLVRPDGFVAWRAETMSDAANEVLTEVFAKLLIRSSPGDPVAEIAHSTLR
jgi:2-polyprenyl-6-methoxyphenol hydroxylase-like FAD-dependent oxidoreductase